jgi:hypothetical protein
MKNKSLICGLVLAVFLAAATTAWAAGPEAVVKVDDVDVGMVMPNQKTSYDFWVENAGDKTLVVEKVAPG